MTKTTSAQTHLRVFSIVGMISALALLVGFFIMSPRVFASCVRSNIIYCGLPGGQQSIIDTLKNQYNTSNDNGHRDIRQVLQWGGFNDQVVGGLSTNNTRMGTLNRAGEIWVSGRKVGHGTQITARYTSGSGFTEIMPGIWSRLATREMAGDNRPVLVYMNADGNARAAIMTDCGNPLRFTPVDKPAPPPAPKPTPQTPTTPPPPPPAPKPSVVCEALTAKPLAGKPLEYTFTVTAKVENDKVKSYDFGFGDGQRAKVNTAATTATTTHKFAPGKRYTIVASVNTDSRTGVTSNTCKATITIPLYECMELTGPAPRDLAYTFTAKGRATNGAKLVSGDFNFGDGTSIRDVKPNGDMVSVDHSYAEAGTYSVEAVLTFEIEGHAYKAAGCFASVKPQMPPVPECKPGIPVGDQRCNPCEYDASLPAGDVRCVPPPQVLPATGAGNIIVIGLAALIGGFLFYKNRLYSKQKLDFDALTNGPTGWFTRSTQRRRNIPQTKRGHQKHTLRRRRPF